MLARGGRFAPRRFSRLATEQNNSKKPPQWRQIRVHNGRRSSSPSPFLLAPTPKALRHPLRRGHLRRLTVLPWARAPPCVCRRSFWRAVAATNPRRAPSQMICGIIRAPALPLLPSQPTNLHRRHLTALSDLAARRRGGVPTVKRSCLADTFILRILVAQPLQPLRTSREFFCLPETSHPVLAWTRRPRPPQASSVSASYCIFCGFSSRYFTSHPLLSSAAPGILRKCVLLLFV